MRLSEGSAHLHRVLTRLDRTAAAKIHPNDTPKVIRAIEVCLTARQPMTELWKQGRDPLQGFNILRIGLDPAREALYARINHRAAQMFERGLIEETAAAAAALWRPRHCASRLALSVTSRRSHFSGGEMTLAAGGSRRAAGPSQLREAPDDVVPPRTRCSLAARIRR